MKLIWRRITDTFTLVDWSDSKRRDELPYEYVNGKGPKFWYVPPATIGGARYNDYVQLGENAGKALDTNTFPNRLYIGTVLTHRENELVNKYLLAASQRLDDITKQIIDAETITTVI